MTKTRAGAQGRLVDIVERGQPAREELAIDHALGKAVHRAEAEPE